MLRLFNTLGKKLEPFQAADGKTVSLFTCGPSVYQRSHIGNFRTFLFEDILIRFLAHIGYRVRRGMNFTDLEDKAIEEARIRKMALRDLTEENIQHFLREMSLFEMKRPDYLPRASKTIDEAVEIIEELLSRENAYWHRGNVYFDALKFPDFGRLYGLNMKKWPKKKRRFHKDTYPGMRWNLGDFILWHGYKGDEQPCWETKIGKGRPSWNVQDPSMISKYFDQTLSIYCGGIDNLYRHHDYTRAILESIRPYPVARFWLHCHHLVVDGQKMSKSRGNMTYTEDLLNQGFNIREIRFFLIYGHYRKKLNYSKETIRSVVGKLRTFQGWVARLKERAHPPADGGEIATKLKERFSRKMEEDLDVQGAFDEISPFLSKIDVSGLSPGAAFGAMKALKEIDEVLRVLF